MIDRTDLKGDCARCAALCCVVFAFDRGEDFAVDKAAGEPCPNIGECGECRIYESRSERGFRGCSRFECFGAGQRVVQGMFDGRSWQTEPELLAPMTRAFGPMKKACELLFAVTYAKERWRSSAALDRLGEIERVLEEITADVIADGVHGRLLNIDAELRGIFAAESERISGI